jgi:hypothetical protein
VPNPVQSAEAATGDRAEPAPSSTAAAASDLERLRALLLGDERRTLDALDARVDALDRNQSELASRLPAAIEGAQQGEGAARMARALAAPLTHALGAAVRSNRQIIVDALFPVIGPAIRKAIAEALRNLVADVNRAVESSFTPRGLRWRIQAWRSGVSYAEIVLKHTLKYRIDHVFLIERESGLVLDRESAPHLPDLDADAIAGMLTAIGEFVRDSVGSEGGGTLDAARVGEHLLWVVQGPRANLACFIHGVPPPKLRALLEERLEAIHARLAAGETGTDAAWRSTLRPDALVRDFEMAEPAQAARPSRLPLLLIALAVLALLAWGIARRERNNAWIENLRARLSTHPGFVLTGIDASRNGVTIHGLLDPDADPPEPLLEGDPFARPVRLDATGYVSTDDDVLARRARRLLQAPESVTVTVRSGTLVLGGHAGAAWIDAARERAAWVPGVRAVELGIARDDAAAGARDALRRIAAAMPGRRVAFVRETEPAPESAAVLDAIIADALRAQALGASAGVPVAWIAVGTNDDPGSSVTNARLRADRARWLADALRARGLANVEAVSDDPAAADVRERGAFLRFAGADP